MTAQEEREARMADRERELIQLATRDALRRAALAATVAEGLQFNGRAPQWSHCENCSGTSPFSWDSEFRFEGREYSSAGCCPQCAVESAVRLLLDDPENPEDLLRAAGSPR